MGGVSRYPLIPGGCDPFRALSILVPVVTFEHEAPYVTHIFILLSLQPHWGCVCINLALSYNYPILSWTVRVIAPFGV